MQYLFAGNSSDIVWVKAMHEILSEQAIFQDSRLGKVLSLPHVSFNIEDSRQRWVVSRKPSMNPAFAIAEVFSILGGSNDAKFLNFWNPALPKYAGHTSEYYGAYGFRLRKHFGFDQIEGAFMALTNNPISRQVTLQIWDPVSDFPSPNGAPRADDIPCNVCSLLKLRDGKLDWLQIMRSNDLYRGTPYNFVQFTTLQEIIAGWLGAEIGNYCQISDSLHLYKDDLTEIDQTNVKSTKNIYKNTDDLRLDKSSWEDVFKEVYEDMKLMSDKSISKNNFIKTCHKNNVPKSYSNLLLVAAADCARRHGWNDEMREAMGACSNRLLVALWGEWENRMMAT